MRTIVRKTFTVETKRFDFDNEFAYIEIWSNAHLKDCYFAEKEFIFPDGSIKSHGRKYFYSPYSGAEIEKEIKTVDCSKFRWFDKLFYFDDDGEIFRIDGTPAESVDNSIECS